MITEPAAVRATIQVPSRSMRRLEVSMRLMLVITLILAVGGSLYFIAVGLLHQ
ncbi:hypothetical protein [Nonomuraea sp. NPDC049504]|uniref:hypothetical protein n=1 Tax=Nonomuraea sp. NPDC049504 TaxID=3154729 RepID=UPI0034160FA9